MSISFQPQNWQGRLGRRQGQATQTMYSNGWRQYRCAWMLLGGDSHPNWPCEIGHTGSAESGARVGGWQNVLLQCTCRYCSCWGRSTTARRIRPEEVGETNFQLAQSVRLSTWGSQFIGSLCVQSRVWNLISQLGEFPGIQGDSMRLGL